MLKLKYLGSCEWTCFDGQIRIIILRSSNYKIEKKILNDRFEDNKLKHCLSVSLIQWFPTFFKLRNTLDKKKVLRNTYSNQ